MTSRITFAPDFRSCLEIRVLEVALRLWSVQGAMGAKIR
ncbi:MAG: hypothetical protein BECKG1743D_GA0114223_110231 [Candidatus Kentron sp. G]